MSFANYIANTKQFDEESAMISWKILISKTNKQLNIH